MIEYTRTRRDTPRPPLGVLPRCLGQLNMLTRGQIQSAELYTALVRPMINQVFPADGWNEVIQRIAKGVPSSQLHDPSPCLRCRFRTKLA